MCAFAELLGDDMDAKITDMTLPHIDEYADLFVEVFNSAPWNDSWTRQTALARIRSMMDCPSFTGKAIYRGDDLLGVIWGQKEPYYDGIHFLVQEFCVRACEQKKGYGTRLLTALRESLANIGVTNIYLVTARGGAEEWYARRGFRTSERMILMTSRF